MLKEWLWTILFIILLSIVIHTRVLFPAKEKPCAREVEFKRTYWDGEKFSETVTYTKCIDNGTVVK